MQVSHQTDHVTHAIIGGKQSIEFGISNSAEFFNILSSTLYKDQILAVVREVLCNAWDAHIEAGCTDRPVQITLTDDTFTIKDFGKGIHQDDMGLIYGTYGNSTKKNDGNQTGGFGLGCKAPFAYTDHFEVVSCHAGIWTIYTLSKSSAQAMGKPGITPIASFPTDESGLTVSIRIKPENRDRFKELIKRIAHNGDMNMTLNGEQLNTLDFDVSKHNFLLTREKLLGTEHRVMVRYGNVIYPVDSDGNNAAYNEIVLHLNTLRGQGHLHFSIVFQAPPHSIAVTPSRESLSMQGHTINTLGVLFKGFLDSLQKEFKDSCMEYTESLLQEAAANKRVDEMFKRSESLPVLKTSSPETRIADFNSMAVAFLQNNYPKGLSYRKADITRRLEVMVQHGLLDRGKAYSFLRELKRVKKECSGMRNWHTICEKNSWLQKQVLAPLLSRLYSAGLPTNQLYTCNPEDHNWKTRPNSAPLVLATQSSPHHLLTTIPYLRNIVVLTSRRADLTERAYKHPVFKEAGEYYGYLVYIVGRKKGEIEAARDFFSKEGMRVADLTISEASEREENRVSQPARKPVKKGLSKLSSTLHPHGIDTTRATRLDAECIDKPEFILQVSYRQGTCTSSLEGWNRVASHQLVQLFGDKGGITNSTATFDKWREKGVPKFDVYVATKICEYLRHNPRVAVYMAHRPEHFYASDQTYLVETIFGNDHLANEFGLVNPLTKEDRIYLDLWKTMTQYHRFYTKPKEMTELTDWINSIPAAPAVTSLKAKLTSKFVNFLDNREFRIAINNAAPHEVPELIAFLKSILK